MAYIPSECTQEQYNNAVYSEDAKHKLFLSFNNVEYTTAQNDVSKVTITSNLIDTTKKTFSLGNLISKNVELQMRNITSSSIVDDVIIKIGTYINETIGYVYVPIGKFIIQDTPTISNGITTIKLRDYAVKLDVPYNGEPLITANGGSATKLQILQDICTQCGVTCNISTFRGSSELVGTYDNTINARTYVSYLAEQAGCFASINRDGELIFINKSTLVTDTLPRTYIEQYTNGDSYNVSKVIYESGIIKYENPSTDATKDILYLDSANPYINSQDVVNGIYNLINGFEINSLNVSRILGNPCIDQYDFITFTDNSVVYKTLGQNVLTYNGKLSQTFDTQISKENRTTNVTKNSTATVKKWAKTEIDNITAEVTIQTGQITSVRDDLSNNYYTKEQSNTLVQNATDGLVNTFTSVGGNNFWKNTYFSEYENNALTYWNGDLSKVNEGDSATFTAGLLPNGEVSQSVSLKNGTYTNTFYFKKLISTATASVTYNNKTITLTGDVGTAVKVSTTGSITTGVIEIKFTCDTAGGYEFYELMLNEGDKASVYSQAINETISDTVKIGKGIQVNNSAINSYTRLDADGLRGYNTKTNSLTFSQTDDGIYGDKLTSNSAQIGNLVIRTSNGHNFISGV